MERQRAPINFEPERSGRSKERRKLMTMSGAITGGSFGTQGGPVWTLVGLAVGGATGYLLEYFIRKHETPDISSKSNPTS